MDILYWFLPLIIGLGIVTSYEDLKFGKIKNKWITFFVFASIIVNIIMIIMLKDSINRQYYLDFLVNMAISLFIGFLLFYLDTWSEGDGKLFFAYAIIMPLTVYSDAYYPYFPAFNLLVNIFIPYLAYSVLVFILNPDKEIVSDALKELFSLELIKSVIKLFSILWIIGFLLSKMGIQSYFAIYGLGFVAYGLLGIIEKKYKKPVLVAAVSISILRLFFDKSIYNYQFWISFLLITLVYRMIFTSFLRSVIFKTASEKLNKNELKEGMTLAYPIEKKKNKFSLVKRIDDDKKDFFIRSGSVLTEKDIIKIKKSGISFKIPVYKKIPFAHIMFLGVIITILTKGNILIYLINFFK